MSDSLTLRFKQDKETKNTFRYAEVERENEPIVVGSLYLQKFIAQRMGVAGEGAMVEVTVSAVKPASKPASKRSVHKPAQDTAAPIPASKQTK
jgi:hypothetical protein